MPAQPHFPVSDHCDGSRFFNPRGHVNRTWREVLKWRRTSQARPWPQSVPVAPTVLPQATPGHWACTYVNHSTFLLQTAQGNVLTDPVYSAHAGPFGRLGPKRAHSPGVPFADLPEIDVVLLSHDHYDHCDLPTLQRLAARFQPHAITPIGNGALLRRAGFPAEKITELDWWQSHRTAAGLSVTVTPSRHWSNRIRGPRNGRLWGGFYLAGGSHRIAFVGDTGYDAEFFASIRQRLGAPDLALIPIGAYEPRWFMAPQHCNPAEAVQIHRDLGARQSIAMHWGTFQLTDEAREDPLRALTAARTAAGLAADEFLVLQPGESWLA
jgi:L-ascorbate metabolism protein UlaG (beta-lactamase superfamily)